MRYSIVELLKKVFEVSAQREHTIVVSQPDQPKIFKPSDKHISSISTHAHIALCMSSLLFCKAEKEWPHLLNILSMYQNDLIEKSATD